MFANCVNADETVDIGRARNGRFEKGNSFARGNPYTKRVANLRKTLVEAVTEQDITEVMESLVSSAKQGDVAAAKLVLLYTIGHPQTFENPDLKVSPHLVETQINALVNEIKTQLLVVNSIGTLAPEFQRVIQARFMEVLKTSAT